MKKIILLSLLGVSLLTMTSCNIDSFLNNDTQYLEYNDGSKISYKISKTQYKRVCNYMDILDDVIDSGSLSTSGTIKLNLYFPKIQDFLIESLSARNKAYIAYSIDKSNGKDNYLELYEYSINIYNWYKNFLKKAYENEEFKAIFGDRTDEEIEALIGKTYSDKFNELSKQITTYESEFTDLNQKSSTFAADSVEIYANIINTCKQLAKETEYDNYIDYAYNEVYSRDYTKEEATSYASYVNEYLLPFYVENKYDIEDVKKDLTDEEYNVFKSIFTDDYESSIQLFSEYESSMEDDDLIATYNNFINGYSFYAKTSNSYSGAYTVVDIKESKAFCYFGKSYQDVFTLVHEFGHMNAMNYQLKNDVSSNNMDLNETQSQGNEYLFLKYFENNHSNVYTDKVIECLTKYRIFDSIKTIIMCAILDQFEQKVYSNDFVATKDNLDDTMKEVCNDFGGYDYIKENVYDLIEYYHRAIVTSKLYYISYSTSLIASLNLYVKANTDYNNAVSIYENIYKITSSTNSFLSCLENAGLTNPLEEESVKEIRKIFD